MSWWISGKPSVVGAAAGAVAGLVAITPASGYVQPMESIAIGARRGQRSASSRSQWRAKSKLDDSLDVVAVHGIGGLWGALATGIFCVGRRSADVRWPHERRWPRPALAAGCGRCGRRALLLRDDVRHTQGPRPDDRHPRSARRTRSPGSTSRSTASAPTSSAAAGRCWASRRRSRCTPRRRRLRPSRREHARSGRARPH